MYYAAYYSILALFIKYNLNSKTHQLFGKHFVSSGLVSTDLAKYYTRIFEYRQKSDYDDFSNFSENQVNELLKETKIFITNIVKLLNQQ